MPVPRQRIVLAVALLTAAVDSTARADQASPPSEALLVLGPVGAVAGGAISYYTDLRDPSHSSLGWLAVASLGMLAIEGGVALNATWGWRRGEYRFASDLAAGVPIQPRRSLAATGFTLGAVGIAGIVAGAVYLHYRALECVNSGRLYADALQCETDARQIYYFIDVVSIGILLVAAPIAGYGFGYDSAARRARQQRTSLYYLIAPTYVAGVDGRGGLGLGLAGRF